MALLALICIHQIVNQCLGKSIRLAQAMKLSLFVGRRPNPATGLLSVTSGLNLREGWANRPCKVGCSRGIYSTEITDLSRAVLHEAPKELVTYITAGNDQIGIYSSLPAACQNTAVILFYNCFLQRPAVDQLRLFTRHQTNIKIVF